MKWIGSTMVCVIMELQLLQICPFKELAHFMLALKELGLCSSIKEGGVFQFLRRIRCWCGGWGDCLALLGADNLPARRRGWWGLGCWCRGCLNGRWQRRGGWSAWKGRRRRSGWWWKYGWRQWLRSILIQIENYLVGAILEAILGSQGHINDVGGNLDFSALSLRSPHQEFCSPSFISSFCRRALPSHSFGSWGQVLLGIQGEREAGAEDEREGEGLLLTCQRMAEIHALASQGRVHSRHFLDVSESRKFKEQSRETCSSFHFHSQYIPYRPHFFDQISKCWPNFTILTRFHNFEQISEFWPNFRMLANFQNFDQSLQFLKKRLTILIKF